MFEEAEDRAIQEAGEWVTINGHPELKTLAAVASKDVANCARIMRDLAEGQAMLIITDGCN
jgi:hypothetical protein